MDDATYQGCSNYPTWAVALWIDNDEWMQSEAIRMAGYWMDSQELKAQSEVTDELKQFVESLLPDTRNDMFGDLLNWALEMVNWRELATHYLETARENQESDNGDS